MIASLTADRIEIPAIWKTVQDDLPVLKAAVLGALTTRSPHWEVL